MLNLRTFNITCPFQKPGEPCCTLDGPIATQKGRCIGCKKQVVEIHRGVVLQHFELSLRVKNIEQAMRAALHLCESLLAVREGATDAVITEVRDALDLALHDPTKDMPFMTIFAHTFAARKAELAELMRTTGKSAAQIFSEYVGDGDGDGDDGDGKHSASS